MCGVQFLSCMSEKAGRSVVKVRVSSSEIDGVEWCLKRRGFNKNRVASDVWGCRAEIRMDVVSVEKGRSPPMPPSSSCTYKVWVCVCVSKWQVASDRRARLDSRAQQNLPKGKAKGARGEEH